MRSASPVSEYTLEKIDTLDKLREIQSDWNRLYELKSEINLFFSFDVIYQYYQIIIKNFKYVKINCLILRNDRHQIIAVFPFMYTSKPFPSFLPFKDVSLQHDYLLDFYYFLTDPCENQQKIFESLLWYFKKNQKEWDILKINYIPKNEPLLNIFFSTFKETYKINTEQIQTLVIASQETFDKYIEKMDNKDKKDIRRQIHRLEKEGAVSLQEIKEPQEVQQGLHVFYDIEDSGWKGKEGTSLKQSFYGEYYRELAMHYSNKGKFGLYLLKLNTESIAGVYAIIDKGIFYIVKTGYLEKYSQYSPSKVLSFLLFEQLFKNKTIQKIDYYGPYLDYEKTFGTNTRTRYKITIINRKILPTFYFVFLSILKVLNYPFSEHSLRDKILKKIRRLT